MAKPSRGMYCTPLRTQRGAIAAASKNSYWKARAPHAASANDLAEKHIALAVSVMLERPFPRTDRGGYIDSITEYSPALSWQYTPEAMFELLQYFQVIPERCRRAIFDKLSIDDIVVGASRYHLQRYDFFEDFFGGDNHWNLFSSWIRRPSQILVRRNYDSDVEISYRCPSMRGPSSYGRSRMLSAAMDSNLHGFCIHVEQKRSHRWRVIPHAIFQVS